MVQYCKGILHHCNSKIVERYNKYTHNLLLLLASDTIVIQSPLNHRWKTMGKIITPLPDHQYWIRVDRSGRITLRNLCFLKPAPTTIPSATPGPINPASNIPLLHPYPSTSSCNGTHTVIEPHKQTTYTSPHLQSSRIPQTLSRLLPHNTPGLKEGYSPHKTQPTRGGGEGRYRSYCSNVQNKQ